MQSYFSTDGRIVGGEDASEFAWPWQVYITLRGRFVCGGTLISTQHCITGAHCIIGQSNDADDFNIRVGAHNMARQGYYAGTTYGISTIYVHENYVSAEYGYDMAIMVLDRPISVSNTVNYICLPNSGFELPMYQPVVITGFGLTREGGALPYSLQQAVIQNLPTCSNAYGLFDSSRQICAGIQSGGVDTCQGDSGGPLVYSPRRSDRWYLVGITSYGNGCARVNYPGVYTKVSAYIEWIQQILAQ